MQFVSLTYAGAATKLKAESMDIEKWRSQARSHHTPGAAPPVDAMPRRPRIAITRLHTPYGQSANQVAQHNGKPLQVRFSTRSDGDAFTPTPALGQQQQAVQISYERCERRATQANNAAPARVRARLDKTRNKSPKAATPRAYHSRISMSSFDLPKTPGGAAFGSSKRFVAPQARSPGPCAYSPATTLNFSVSTLSHSASMPAFAIPKFELPDMSAKNGASPKQLRLPSAFGETQVSSQKKNGPAYSMGANYRSAVRTPEMPSPLAYKLSGPPIYEARAERSLGTEDRGVTEMKYYQTAGPGPITSLSESDSLTRRNNKISRPLGGRDMWKPTRAFERSPGPHCSGDVMGTYTKLLPEAASCSFGSRQPYRRPLTPSPTTYDARSLYWNGKKPLGRSGLRTKR
jgi:hypothetical protein